jgi:predicted glycoside hydrolase/deacetylase ChbG (UPF0249 family)
VREGAGRVWVTVDDFGLSAEANREIVKLAERGVVTAVSVMVHASACTEGLAELSAMPVRIGLHATFTDGLALSPELGRLPRAWWSLAPGLLDQRAVGRFAHELCEQSERLIDAAGRIDFVNSHEHVHLLPALWPAIVGAVWRYDIPAVRLPGWPPRGRGPEAAMACVAALARRRARLPRGTITTEPLGVLRAGRLDEPTIRELLHRHRGREHAIELCCHPVTTRGSTPESILLASGAIDRVVAELGFIRERLTPSRIDD